MAADCKSALLRVQRFESSPVHHFQMLNEKRYWRAYYWNEDTQKYDESFPLTKSIAKLALKDDPNCHYIQKVEGWFQRVIWRDGSNDVTMVNVVAGGDVAGRDLIKA